MKDFISTLSLNPATQITTEFPVIPSTTVSVKRTMLTLSMMASTSTVVAWSFLEDMTATAGREAFGNIVQLKKRENPQKSKHYKARR